MTEQDWQRLSQAIRATSYSYISCNPAASDVLLTLARFVEYPEDAKRYIENRHETDRKMRIVR